MSDLELFLAEANKDFKIVTVKFESSKTVRLDSASSNKTYTYKTVLDVKEGDKVIVDSPSSGMVIVDVIEAVPAIETNLDFGFQVKWIVSKVDIENYEECKEMERKALKQINMLKYTNKRKELLKDLTEVIGEDGIRQIKQLVRL